jgi:hypothetical protein
MPFSALETADAVALNAVFEVSGMTRMSPPARISSDFRTGDGSRERISCRIPFARTDDPSVAAGGNGHSLISSASSLFLGFVMQELDGPSALQRQRIVQGGSIE